MGDMTRRELIARSIGGGIALRVPLDAFAQTRDQIPAEIETKIPSAEAIDMIVRDFVREMNGKPFESNALATRIISGGRLAGYRLSTTEDASSNALSDYGFCSPATRQR